MAVLLAGQLLQAQLSPSQRDDIGLTSLQTRLGGGAPTGAGISVSQVEARLNPPAEGETAAPAIYRPDATLFPGKNFQYPSGGSAVSSGHATTVGEYFYGASSAAPGIGVAPNRISVYDAANFLGGGFLRTTQSGVLPLVETNDVQNHSWVGDVSDPAVNIEAVRRLDFAIQRDDFVATIGLNNGSGTVVPTLLAGAYNGITVGRSDGEHSRGGTMLDGGFRTRPDIVVPTNATSWGAPTVGGAASLLLQSARTTPGSGNAARSFVVKSLLMTGASREESEFTRAWANTSSNPLDVVYGAGELDIDRSHQILEAGEQNAASASVVGATGWDEGQANATVPQTYFFDLPAGSSSFQLAASLVWNRTITAANGGTGANPDFTFNPSLADLNLRLYQVTGFTLGTELAASLSNTENVELIEAKGLSAGRYAWQVSSDTNGTEYGLSWITGEFSAIPEPSTWLFVLGGSVLMLSRRVRGCGN